MESNAFSKSRNIARPGRFFCCGVANNITNESYVFTDVPSFDIAGLISVYHKRQNGFQSFCDCFRGNFVVCV